MGCLSVGSVGPFRAGQRRVRVVGRCCLGDYRQETKNRWLRRKSASGMLSTCSAIAIRRLCSVIKEHCLVMARIKLMALAILAVFCLGAVASAAASASEGEFVNKAEEALKKKQVHEFRRRSGSGNESGRHDEMHVGH